LPLVATAVLLSLMAAAVGWWLGRNVGAAASDGEYPAIVSEFRLPSLDGRELSPVDFQGRVVVVDFWATWCAPCHIQARILEELHRVFDPAAVQFLAVSVGEREEVVRRFAEERPFPYPVLYDEPGRLSREGNVLALPTVMVLDPAGRIVYYQPGISSGERLLAAIEEAMGVSDLSPSTS
jgi:peroxiredoxin